MPRISFSRLVVTDQLRARAFYTDVLGFQLAIDEPAGPDRLLTVVSDDDPDGVQLVLDPEIDRGARTRAQQLYTQGMPATSFEVDDVDYEYERLTSSGVTFQSPPVDSGSMRMCVLNDTCGNWIRLTQRIED